MHPQLAHVDKPAPSCLITSIPKVPRNNSGVAPALGTLTLFTYTQQLFMIVGFIILSGLFPEIKMHNGPTPGRVFQYAFSVTLASVISASSTQDPVYARFTRVIPTFGKTFIAAKAVTLLDDDADQWESNTTDLEVEAASAAI